MTALPLPRAGVGVTAVTAPMTVGAVTAGNGGTCRCRAGDGRRPSLPRRWRRYRRYRTGDGRRGNGRYRRYRAGAQRVNNPTLWANYNPMLGRADVEGSKSNVALNAWLPQASYPCGNFSDTSEGN